LSCACDACALLFSGEGPLKYRRVPRRILYLSQFQLSDEQWDSLMIPINMVFLFKSTPRGRATAMYPSPAGPTESLLDLDAWSQIVAQNQILETLEPDVEALLVNRLDRGAPHVVPASLQEIQNDGAQHYLTPIDECYKLVGVIRAHWRGLSGGKEVWEEINRFFADLKSRSKSV